MLAIRGSVDRGGQPREEAGLGWILAALAAGLALVAARAGMAVSRRPGHGWLVAFFTSLSFVTAVMLARRFLEVSFVPPFSWLTHGRLESVLIGPATAILFSAVAPRLSRQAYRRAVSVFAVVAIAYFSLLPFVMPELLRGYLGGLDTQVDSDGLCLQNTAFTCGPAACVTALKRLGIDASEGELAVLSYANPVSGSEPDLVCAAVNRRYGSQGISCRHVVLASPDEVPENAQFVAIVRKSLLVDHYVAVLDVNTQSVVTADPLSGKITRTRAEFDRIWRRSGIVLERSNRDNRTGR